MTNVAGEGPAAVLWTGGKDSALALFRAAEAGRRIALLATFVPALDASFAAHPIAEMRRQAATLGLPLQLLVVREPFRESYAAALAGLRNAHGINMVITGDIDLVDGHPNWIEECCAGLDVGVERPLWRAPRVHLLRELVARGIEARVSYVDERVLSRAWVGRCIDAGFIADIAALAESGVDACGENGEYHTMVTRFPPLPPPR